jgi:hypothetical protein
MTDWRNHAACAGMPLNAFFPERGQTATDAYAACARCPVRTECDQEANRDDLDYRTIGIWAGRHRRNNGNERGNTTPAPIREQALELWRQHRASYRSDSACARAIESRLEGIGRTAILTWARRAGLATAGWPRSIEPDRRAAVLAAYRQVRPHHRTKTAAADEIAAREGVSRTVILTWLRAEERPKAHSGA